MTQRYSSLLYIMFFSIVVASCVTAKASYDTLFAVKDAYYQSWVRGETERGTNIVVEIVDLDTHVVFDSIIFNGKKLPVFVTQKEGITYLKSFETTGFSTLNSKGTPTEYSDRIIYHYKGSPRTYIFPAKIRRLDMQYY